MRYSCACLAICLIGFALDSQAQQSSVPQAPQPALQGDQQAIAILKQSLAAAGWTGGAGNPSDFEGTGKITYYVDGQEIIGTATVKGRGPDQFRMDAQLPHGTRSIVVDRGHWKLGEPGGTRLAIPSIAVSGIGLLTDPYPAIAAALDDPRSRMAYVGMAEVSGHQTYQIRVVRPRPLSPYPPDFRLLFSRVDYFIDMASALILRLADSTYRTDPPSNFPHTIDFDEYTTVDSVLVPMHISEKFKSIDVWVLQLNDFKHHAGLDDSQFALQE